MSYSRRILHYSPGPTDFQSLISDRAVAGCSFELNRLGGCGKGELKLNDEFANRSTINVGDWIAFEYSEGDRWYMGRVEHRSATVPAGVSFQLEGMSVELSEVFAGGFNPTVGQGIPPHRYAKTDLFPNDPDRNVESVDIVSEPRELVILLMQQYVVPNSHITLDTSLVDTLTNPSSVTSLKLRGEESIQSVIKDLALRAGHASWGVQPDGKFFYLQKPTTVAATWRIGRDFISLEETIERNQLYNRITLTGGYVYDEKINSGHNARGIYRWRGNYTQPASRSQHGERRIRMNIPWIRTSADSREFAREFFRVYAEPTTRYFLEVGNQSALLTPWTGQVKIEDQSGQEIFTSAVETVRVQFDHAPRFQVEIGPDDPQLHWPEPSIDERWEIPENTPANPISNGGDEISLTYFGTESLSGLPSSSTSSTSSSSYSPSSSYSSSSFYSSSASYSSSSSSTPPPCGVAHDTFTDTDGTALASHTMDIGTGWTVESGTWTIQSNVVEVSTGKTNYSTTASDAKVECDITHGSSGANAVYLHFRRTDATNYWYIDIYTANNSLKLMSKTGGTATQIAEYDMGSVSAGDSHLYAVRCDGDIIMVDIDGTEVLNHESSLRNTATGFALEAVRVSGSAVNIFDNFCVEEYTDTTKPSCTLTTPASTVTTDTFTVTAIFSKEVTGFALGDISITNGTASSLSGSGKDYTFTITATAVGDVTTSVAADVATDSNSNTNSASNSLVTTYTPAICDPSFPTTYPTVCLTLGLIDTDDYSDIKQGNLTWSEYEMGAFAWNGTVDGGTWYIECSGGVYSLRSDLGYDEDSTGGTFPDLTFPGVLAENRTSMETAVTCPLNEEPPA